MRRLFKQINERSGEFMVVQVLLSLRFRHCGERVENFLELVFGGEFSVYDCHFEVRIENFGGRRGHFFQRQEIFAFQKGALV